MSEFTSGVIVGGCIVLGVELTVVGWVVLLTVRWWRRGRGQS
jgi:hypothetical protein